jgi:hypothetical protein
MKIVQSYWAKPSMKNESLHQSDRNKGGWRDKKYNYMSWALSCLQFRKFYPEVELVTDKIGFDLLINKLELPYTKVDVRLDDLNGYHSDLWALGKVFTYGLQDSPFIHADSDVFIYSGFSSALENSGLIAQNIERGFHYYDKLVKSIQSSFAYVPECINNSVEKNGGILSVNAGLLGGNNINFFKSYVKESFAFIDENVDRLGLIDIGLFNNVFEQILFYAMSERAELSIHYQLSNVNHAFDNLANLTDVPVKRHFVHTVGIYKRMQYIADLVEYRLLSDHPEYYFKIKKLMGANFI